MSDLLNDRTTTEILQPDGSLAHKPTILLSAEEAAMLRTYKKFLHQRGIREAWYCASCWDGHREDGMRAHVTDAQIYAECRCRTLFHQGQTF